MINKSAIIDLTMSFLLLIALIGFVNKDTSADAVWRFIVDISSGFLGVLCRFWLYIVFWVAFTQGERGAYEVS